MKEKLLGQMNRELKLATRLDLVIMVIVVAVTLIFFGVAAGSAQSSVAASSSGLSLGGILGGSGGPVTYSFKIAPTIILFVTLVIIAIVNWYGVRALNRNKAQRAKLNEGLAKLLKDETLDQYNDGAIYKSYETRYGLFTVIMGAVAALSIIVPVVVFINQLITKL